MPVYSSVIMISFAMNCLEVLAHHLPIIKTLQNKSFLLALIFFEIRNHITISNVQVPVRELLPPSSLPLPQPHDDVTFAYNIF